MIEYRVRYTDPQAAGLPRTVFETTDADMARSINTALQQNGFASWVEYRDVTPWVIAK